MVVLQYTPPPPPFFGGKWGEGIKILCAAALRDGTKVELRSRDWLAVPDCEEVILNKGKDNEKKVKQLFF